VVNPISSGASYPIPKPSTAGSPVPAQALPTPDQLAALSLDGQQAATSPFAGDTSATLPSLDMFGGDLQSVDPQIAAALSMLSDSSSATSSGDVSSLFNSAMQTPNISLAQSAMASYMSAGQDSSSDGTDSSSDTGSVDLFA